MNFTKVAETEALFRNNQKSQYKMEPFNIPLPGEEAQLKGMTCRPSAGYSSYYYDEKIPKDKIVIHYTAGNIAGDFWALTRKNFHVSVPFLIARDGTAYQLFSSGFWSYHLGKGAIGGNKSQSSRSIGIELSNYGYLTERNGNLETIYSRTPKPSGGNNPVDIYCSLQDTDKYVKLKRPFRGQKYFATFTSEQYEQLILLIRYLSKTYNIPTEFLPFKNRFKPTDAVVGFKGILSHVNYRTSGKWDIGPAFDWERVIAGVQATNHSPVDNLKAELEKAKQQLAEAETAYQNAQAKVNELEKKLDEASAGEKGLLIGHASEESIEKANPTGDTAKHIDYGEDGPETGYDPNTME